RPTSAGPAGLAVLAVRTRVHAPSPISVLAGIGDWACSRLRTASTANPAGRAEVGRARRVHGLHLRIGAWKLERVACWTGMSERCIGRRHAAQSLRNVAGEA